MEAGSSVRTPLGAEGAAEPERSAQATGTRPKGAKWVKARYLQYDKKPVRKNTSASCSMVCSVKKPEKGETSTRRAGLEKCKDTTGTVNFQSTLLEDHDIARPDLDVSAINDKSLFKKTPGSKSVLRGESTSHKKEQKSKSFDSEDVIGMMESQALLLTYASIKFARALKRQPLALFWKQKSIQFEACCVAVYTSQAM